MTPGLYRPESIPVHDTAPSEVEPPESTLNPCGCDPAIGQECAICCPHPSRAGTIAAIEALEVEDLPVQEHSLFGERVVVTGCIPKAVLMGETPDALGITGGDHKDAGKPRLELLDPYAMEQVAAVLGFGAIKYSPWNWTRGIAYTRLAGSALRHIFAFMRGDDRDPESGLPHLAHGICCLMMLLGMTQRHPELDDRCKTEAA